MPMQSLPCCVHIRENLLARQTLEQNLVHTGATDLDVAMFHRDGGTSVYSVGYTYPFVSKEWHICFISSLVSSHQVRTRTQTRTCPWRRSAVSPSRPLRVRTMSDFVGASSGDSSGPTTARGCSLSPPRMAPKVS